MRTGSASRCSFSSSTPTSSARSSGPLFQRAQLAIAQVSAAHNLTIVVDKRIVIFGGQDITKDVETLFFGGQAIQPPAASPPPSSIGYVDQTALDSLPKVKTANDEMNQFATTQRTLFAPQLAQAKTDSAAPADLSAVQQVGQRQTGSTPQTPRRRHEARDRRRSRQKEAYSGRRSRRRDLRGHGHHGGCPK